ncbi:hypothetical protein ASE01_15200 [Nocardioides sp. Root190]|uniref:hypothetical protein n=1 Tax=Nocardioides sp. Root190 TaxID=1736488 RepID=UPI0006F7E42B|nr:hypothetical protein [Nocardioides sp. Root190]KRB76343.1 hypothetical protein ASE01_15200 [Nocardioides sp. Root190]
MTADSVRAALEELKEPLVEAVINAYMRKKLSADVDNFYFDPSEEGGSCEAGEFRYKLPRAFADKGVYCYYPSGVWKIDHNIASDVTTSAGDKNIEGEHVSLPDLVPIWDEIRTEIHSWIDPWMDAVDPDDFSDQVASVVLIAQQLHIGESTTTTQSSPDGTARTLSAVTDIQSAVDDSKSDLTLMSGGAVRSLQLSYTNDVGRTISGQQNLAAVAALALAAEVMAWTECYTTLTEFLKAATADFNSFANATDGSGPSFTPVALSALSGAATVVAGTAVFPPAAAAAAVVAGIATVAVAFWPNDSYAASKDVRVVLEGGDYTALLGSFMSNVREIEDDVFRAEYAIGRMCRSAVEDMYEKPDNYSIARRLRSGERQPNDPLQSFLDADVDLVVKPRLMRDIAGRIETISRHQRGLASRLSGDASALASAHWSRPALHGDTIGYGTTGAFDQYADLVNQLVDLLVDEARTSHRVAVQCLDLATDFEQTDLGAKEELAKINRGLTHLHQQFNTVDDSSWKG